MKKELFAVVAEYYFGSTGIPGNTFYTVRAATGADAENKIRNMYDRLEQYRVVAVTAYKANIIEA